MKIAILGADGFIGSGLLTYFKTVETIIENSKAPKDRYTYHAITRDNYFCYIGDEFDIFINAAGNSRKFWANKYPVEDFELSTIGVMHSFNDFFMKKYIYISSVDVYNNIINNTLRKRENVEIYGSELEPYGFNKFLAEQIVQKYAKNYLILRCSAVIGKNLKKGVIKDLLNDVKIRVSKDTQIQFITVKAIGMIIFELLEQLQENEIFNVGGIGALRVWEIAQMLGINSFKTTYGKNKNYNVNVSKLNSVFELLSTRNYIQEFIDEGMDESLQSV